jgi:hypothetical protein
MRSAVDDTIRFVTSHTAARTTTEKANSDTRVTVDEEVSNSDDIQGSEENRIHKQSNQQQQQQQTTLFSNIKCDKPFWIWNIEEHKVADIIIFLRVSLCRIEDSFHLDGLILMCANWTRKPGN